MKKLILLYILLAAVGALLYIEAHAYATEWRGYTAYGGELFILTIPVYAIYQIFHTALKPINDRKDDPHV